MVIADTVTAVMSIQLVLLVSAIALTFTVASATNFGYLASDLQTEAGLVGLFKSWQFKHSLSFEAAELEQRFSIFKDNVKLISEHNLKGQNYTLAVNAFAHLTHDEFKGRYLGYKADLKRPLRSNGKFMHAKVSPPDSIDWRELGAVTHIKNQEQCGENSMLKSASA